MKYAVLLFVLLTSCAQPKSVPWPEPDQDQFLYWKAVANAPWEVFIEPGEGRAIATWDHLPVLVIAEDSLAEETSEAVEAWNSWLGFDVFRYDPKCNDKCDVVVFRNGDLPGVAAMAGFLTIEGRQVGTVRVFNGLESDDRSDIMAHELGHLLSLRHDADNPRSVMHPSSSPRVPYLEQRDRKALRRKYVHGRSNDKAATVPQNKPNK